jgi:hypothetical protein
VQRKISRNSNDGPFTLSSGYTIGSEFRGNVEPDEDRPYVEAIISLDGSEEWAFQPGLRLCAQHSPVPTG